MNTDQHRSDKRYCSFRSVFICGYFLQAHRTATDSGLAAGGPFMIRYLVVGLGLLLAPAVFADEKPFKGPLAEVPSKPGPHIEKIKALGDNEWLNLGSPAPDPKWGKARGRSWSSNQPA